ncbi:nuclear transport factor 2 family protein [Paraburkholderia panacisoli]|uniref:Nuclear transport factor 2 family protein n=1 Tax=Paraburkholderia panacisoli TaxID=2603818 RepID=A0A5B0GN10_9BURK|nr:nuclear transport factor 2 family protein [Paraburkholderia panacisoli]KAA1004894.1 nuclear transport factor 2 family protein [Paraburkholderia panacisoli]
MRNLEQMFAAVDRKDANGFVAHLSENVVFQFGNQPELKGREAVAAGVTDFFNVIAGLRHAPTGGWDVGDYSIRCFMAIYRRLDGIEVSVPCACFLRHEATGLIDDYRIYIDLAPVFANVVAVPATAVA